MGDRHIRVGSTIYHMVDVPDAVTDEQISETLKLRMMLDDKQRIKKVIQEKGVVAS